MEDVAAVSASSKGNYATRQRRGPAPGAGVVPIPPPGELARLAIALGHLRGKGNPDFAGMDVLLKQAARFRAWLCKERIVPRTDPVVLAAVDREERFGDLPGYERIRGRMPDSYPITLDQFWAVLCGLRPTKERAKEFRARTERAIAADKYFAKDIYDEYLAEGEIRNEAEFWDLYEHVCGFIGPKEQPWREARKRAKSAHRDDEGKFQ